MSCYYTYKGQLIGDIRQLDDFLISKQKYQSKFGDLVFSKSNPQLSSMQRISKINEDAIELNKKYAEAKSKAQLIDDEEILRMTRPYVGVSEFMSGLKNDSGRLWFPEFTTEYWAKRYLDWINGNYTKDEIEAFFNGDEHATYKMELGNQSNWRNSDGSLKDTFGTEEQNKYRQIMENKWKHQAKYGDDIHAIMQSYFSQTKPDKNGNTKYRYELWEGPQGAMQLQNSINYMRKNKIISDNLTDEKIKSILEIAKKFREQIQNQEDFDNCLFYPEITVNAKLNHEYEGRDDLSVLGRIDLLVIDNKGVPHIYDYKTSPKLYDQFSTPKELTFTYQLSMYERMLRRYGFKTSSSTINIVPLQLEGFRKDGDNWEYNKVNLGSPKLIENITEKANKDYINNNLDEYIEAPLVVDANTEDTVKTVTDIMKKCFPEYGQIKTDQQIKELIERQGGFKVNTSSNILEFQPRGWKQVISVENKAGAETELFNKVRQFITGQQERSIKNAQLLITSLKNAQSEDTRQLQLPHNMGDWVGTRLSKYCSKDWEVLDNDAAEIASQFGVILLYNRVNDVMEIIKITNKDLYYQHSWGQGRTNILGSKEADINEDSNSDSLIIKAITGNIELMETMAILNTLSFNKDVQIANVSVLNPILGQGTETNSNKELLYNWEKLRLTFNLEDEDKFQNQYKLLSLAEKVNIEYQDILARINDRWQKSEFLKFQPSITSLQNALLPNNIDECLIALNELKTKLERDFRMSQDILTKGENKGKSIYADYQNYDQQYAKQMYQIVMRAIAELNGFNIRQEVKAHTDYLDSTNFLVNGVSGNKLDNAGNFANKLLNQVTGLALEGYQNTRDLIYSKLRELTTNVELLKKQEGYAGIKEYTIGNQASLYNGMTKYTEDGDLVFENPWKSTTLSEYKKDFLKKAILEFNKNVHPDWTEQVVQDKINLEDREFFQVPLMSASNASKINQDGFIGYIKNKLRPFSSKENIINWLKDIQSNYLTDDIDKQQSIDGEIFQALNRMDAGYGPDRVNIIKELRNKYGDSYFERDIEKLLGAHIMAYSAQKAMQNRMPLIKAAYISLAVMGNMQGQDYSIDEKFIKQYVQSRINSLSIVDPKLRAVKGLLGEIQGTASWMALAFSPLQMTYQQMEGIWKSAKLVFTKYDGKETFTINNMKKAAGLVYKEMFNYSKVPTVLQAVNAVFGINDMDSVAFAENNSSNKYGIFNFFGRIAYHFSSRPDFYNRMTIFTAQMLSDGSYYAHSVDSKGNLIYNIKKDKRFEALFNKPKGSKEYNKAQALYLAIAQQLVREGAVNPDGTLFTINIDKPYLPKAYSNKESESMKAIGDSMYGYYDNSKKSLMQAGFLGGLLMQMRTYWSSKKNQYLAPGGIKSQGKWVQMVSPNGKKCFYSLNSEGKIDKNSMPVEEGDPRASKTPFMQWKGRFEEGAILTLYDLLKRTCGHRGNVKEAWKEKVSEVDEDIVNMYKSNLKLMLSDFLGWLLIGIILGGLLEGLADDEIKKAKKSGEFGDAMFASGTQLLFKTVHNSALDFNAINSLFDISLDWNPFAVSYMSSFLSNTADLAVGDKSFSNYITSSFSGTKPFRPIFNCIENSLKSQ